MSLISEREKIYEELLREFEPIAKLLGGWITEGGVVLDGKLWKLAQDENRSLLLKWRGL